MNVCLISHSGELAGAERCLLEMALALRARRVGVCVVVPRRGALAAELEHCGIRVAVVRMASWMHPVAAGRLSPRWFVKVALHLIAAFRVARLAVRWDCDIICTNTITLCVGAVAARILRRPHIWFIHEFGGPDHGLRFDFGARASFGIIRNNAALIVANSATVARYFQRLLRRRDIRVLSPCPQVTKPVLDGPAVTAPPSTQLRCVFAGGWGAGKRAEDALAAIAELRRAGIRPWLWVLGSGPAERRRWLQQYAVQRGVAQFTEFVGWVPCPSAWFVAADCLLMCSRAEAFGRVALEAMRAGRPVVGARTGAIPELIRDGIDGLLYPVGRPQELALRLARLARDPAMARAMGEQARLRAAEKFSGEDYLERVARLFETALS